MKSPDRDLLIGQIYHAFEGVTLGSGISLIETEYEDVNEIAPQNLIDKEERNDWKKIIDNRLTEFQVTFCFTNPEGFRFYIAPYMIWTLRNYETSAEIIADYTIHALDPHRHPFKEGDFGKIFTDNQIICMESFLVFAVANGDYLDGDEAERRLAKLRTWRTHFGR